MTSPVDEIEPSAEHRRMAREVKQIHVALVKEGFTEKQALEIITKLLAAAIGNQFDQ